MQSIASLYAKLIELAADHENNFLEIGKLLRVAQEENPASFQNLLEIPDIGRRRGYCLIQVEKAFAPFNVDKSRLIKIGWSKLVIIAPVIDAENLEMWLTLAEGNTSRQLQAMLHNESLPANARVVLLYLKPKEYARYRKAMLEYGAYPSGRGLALQEKALMRLLKKLKGK